MQVMCKDLHLLVIEASTLKLSRSWDKCVGDSNLQRLVAAVLMLQPQAHFTSWNYQDL